MIILNSHQKSPHIFLQNKEIRLSIQNKDFSIPVDQVDKIYLKKRRRGFLGSMLSIGAFLENSYDLYICNLDRKQIRMKIMASERPYLLELISKVRNLKRLSGVQTLYTQQFASKAS